MGSSSSAAGRPHTSSGTRVIASPNQYHDHQELVQWHQSAETAQPTHGTSERLYPSLDGAGVDPRRHSMAPSYHYPTQGRHPTQVVHPQVRTDYPGRQRQIPQPITEERTPPNIGFKEVNFENPPQEGANQDTSRDQTLSRVFAADEFLGRMAETDEKIKLMSSVREEDKSSVYERLKQVLGLRGHLQDELLRIQVMLAEDDPDLKCLDGLDDLCPAVQVLRQLNEKAKQIQTGEAQTDQLGKQIDLDLNPLQPNLIDTMIGDDESDEDEEIEYFGGCSGAGTQTDRDTKGEEVKQDLKQKHDERLKVLKEKEVMEELHVADKFAQKITKANKNLSQDEINDLLNQHAISMQALRKKQEVERKYLTDKLEAKKRERMLRRPQLTNRMDSEGVTPRVQPTDSSLYKMPGYVVQLNSDKPQNTESRSTHNLRKGSLPNVPIGRATIITSQKIPDGDQGHLKVKDRKGSASSKGSARRGRAGESLDSDDDLEDLIASVNDEDDEYSSEDFEEDSEGDEEKETMRTTLQDDLWSNRNKITSEDFKALMGAYRNQEDERKKIRQAEKGRHKEGLINRLARQKRREKAEANSRPSSSRKQEENEDENESKNELTADQVEVIKDSDEYFSKEISQKIKNMSNEEFEQLLKRHLADVEVLRRMRNADRDRLDAKLRERLRSAERDDFSDDDEDKDLQNLKSEFTKRLCSKRRYLDEEDLQSLLQQYHKDRTALSQARKGDRDRMDEKLKQKLEAKSRKSKEKAEVMDSGFFERIQAMQANGSLGKEEFDAMLQEYLDKAEGSKKRNKKRTEEQAEEERKHVHRTASALVRESHNQSKQIDLVRQREKAAMDEKLKRKLQMAGPK